MTAEHDLSCTILDFVGLVVMVGKVLDFDLLLGEVASVQVDILLVEVVS